MASSKELPIIYRRRISLCKTSKMKMVLQWFSPVVFATTLLVSCNNDFASDTRATGDTSTRKGSYGYDLAFLRQHTKGILELTSDDSSARLLLSPEWQGRVMTSTASGD